MFSFNISSPLFSLYPPYWSPGSQSFFQCVTLSVYAEENTAFLGRWDQAPPCPLGKTEKSTWTGIKFRLWHLLLFDWGWVTAVCFTLVLYRLKWGGGNACFSFAENSTMLRKLTCFLSFPPLYLFPGETWTNVYTPPDRDQPQDK